MIWALLLIFDPATTWEKIKNARHSATRLSLTTFLPLLLLTSAVELFGTVQLGVDRSALVEKVVKVPFAVVLRYETIQILLTLLVVYAGAGMLIQIGASFHRRHSYTECFTTLGYSFTPLLLLRMLNAVPALNSWACYGIGIFLTLSLFYRGIPFILKPDPSNALGLFMFCSFLLLISTGLAHFVAQMVLEEKLFA